MPTKTTKISSRAAKAPAKRVSRQAAAPVAAPARDAPTGKLGDLVQLLSRPQGATLDEMVTTSGWQPHSVRGAISGSLKKTLGYAVSSTKTDGTRVYRIEPSAAATGPMGGAGA